MTRPARPGRGALLQVALSRGETTDWDGDHPGTREEIRRGYARMAARHGRRFVELRSHRGALLTVVEAVRA